jgi:hypothetical protein
MPGRFFSIKNGGDNFSMARLEIIGNVIRRNTRITSPGNYKESRDLFSGN